VEEDLQTIRSIPVVNSASISSYIPLSGYGISTDFRASLDEDAERLYANFFFVDEEIINTLGLNLLAGRAFQKTDVSIFKPDDYANYAKKAIITEALAQKLYGTSEVVGNLIYDNYGHPAEVIGIVEKMMGIWVTWKHAENVVLYPGILDGVTARYMIRHESTNVNNNELVTQIETKLQGTSIDRVVDTVKPMQKLFNRSYSSQKTISVVLSGVAILMLVLTGLSVYGLSELSFSSRKREIGIKRALGASKALITKTLYKELIIFSLLAILSGCILAKLFNSYFSQTLNLSDLSISSFLYTNLVIFAVLLIGSIKPFFESINANPISVIKSI
jgi:putative ABC transport system permease protein